MVEPPPPPIPPTHVGHALFDAARALAPDKVAPGLALRFESEVDLEDRRSEIVLAMLEGRDPRKTHVTYYARDPLAPLTLGSMSEATLERVSPVVSVGRQPGNPGHRAVAESPDCHPDRPARAGHSLCVACETLVQREKRRLRAATTTPQEVLERVRQHLKETSE